MRRILLALILTASVLAGCTGGDGGSPATVAERAVEDPEWAQRAIFAGKLGADVGYVPDHDHTNRSLHKGLSTSNFELIAHDPLLSAYYDGAPAGTAYCSSLGTTTEGRRLAVVHSHQSDVSFTVVDATDATAPFVVGELVMPFVFTYDVAIFEDGRYVAVVANVDNAGIAKLPEPAGLLGGVPFQPTWRDACTGDERPAGSSVDYLPYGFSTLLVDLADPAMPEVVSFVPHAVRNLHSVSVATVDGTRYVASSGLQAVPCSSPVGVPSNNPEPIPDVPPLPSLPVGTSAACQLAANAGNPRAGNLLSHFVFYTVEESPAGARLVPHTVFSYLQPDDAPGLLTYDTALALQANGHVDASIQKHPITGETIAYMADWDGGFIIARIDGPGRVTELARFYQQDDAHLGYQMTGNAHSVQPLEGLRDGHHYLLVGQEVVGKPEYRPSGEVILVDTTNPATPTPVARWTLPVEVEWSPALGLAFSTHYARADGDILFIPMYHGGVWAADMSPESWPDLPSLGVFLPAEDPPEEAISGRTSPEVLEFQLLGNHTLLVFDGTSGAYTVQFDPTDVSVAPAQPWTKDSWIEAPDA